MTKRKTKGSGHEDTIDPEFKEVKAKAIPLPTWTKGEQWSFALVLTLLIVVGTALVLNSNTAQADEPLLITETLAVLDAADEVTTGPAVEESTSIVKGTLCGWLSNLDPAEYPTAFHYAKDGVGCGALWTGDLKGGGG